MPYPNQFFKVQLHGTMYGGEIWQMGFNMGREGSDAFPDGNGWDQMLDAFKNDLWADTTVGGRLISSYYNLVGIKASLIGTDGKLVGDPSYTDYATPVPGSGSGAPAPQVAVVISTTSDVTRGLATKGRMYLPGFAPALDTTGHIPTTSQTALADRIKTFIDHVNAASLNNKVIHTSPGHKGPLPNPGAAHLVSGFNIGNVMDTQRRRRNALVETRVGRVVTTA